MSSRRKSSTWDILPIRTHLSLSHRPQKHFSNTIVIAVPCTQNKSTDPVPPEQMAHTESPPSLSLMGKREKTVSPWQASSRLSRYPVQQKMSGLQDTHLCGTQLIYTFVGNSPSSLHHKLAANQMNDRL